MIEPWAHGTIVRATRYPSYFAFNLVRVEKDPSMSVDALVELADGALAGLTHRQIDFDPIDAAEARRAGFEARGWKATRLVWMRHARQAQALPPAMGVQEVAYDAVNGLRVAWHEEDFPAQDPTAYLAQAREVALRRNTQVLASLDGGTPVGFAQLERDGQAAEITQVYVRPDHRGHGRGTAITAAAIDAAAGADDLWITADDEDRPKELYARLGFRPVWTAMQFLLER